MFINADWNSKKSGLIHMHHAAHDWRVFMMVNVETYKDPPAGLAGGSLKMLTGIVRSPAGYMCITRRTTGGLL